MRDWLKIIGGSAIACVALSLLLILSVFVAPLMLGGTGLSETQKSIIPALAMLLIMIGGLLYVAAWLLALYEIMVASNNGEWKLLRGLLVCILGVLGIALYLLIARKERR